MHIFNAKKATAKCIEWIQNWFEKNGKDCNAVIGISGGKDSTVVAALCAKALGPSRVIGVILPNGEQADIEDAKDVINYLGIKKVEMNIGSATNIMLARMQDTGLTITQQTRENLPPRIRMSALYMIAQSCDGRVSNNCNLSENWIGYSTIYGDTAGDFSPISDFTVSEVIKVGKEMGLPERFLNKPPADGLCGKTDEDKLGFSYSVLDQYLRTGKIDNLYIKGIIDGLHERNKFKHKLIASFEWDPYCNI